MIYIYTIYYIQNIDKATLGLSIRLLCWWPNGREFAERHIVQQILILLEQNLKVKEIKDIYQLDIYTIYIQITEDLQVGSLSQRSKSA